MAENTDSNSEADSGDEEVTQQDLEGAAVDKNNEPEQEQTDGSQQDGELTQQTTSVSDGDSVTDVFSREDTKSTIVQTVGLFVTLGLGYGIFGYFTVNSFVGDGTDAFVAFGATFVALLVILVAALAGPLLTVTMSMRLNGLLSYLRDDQAYATGAVGSGIGQLILLVLTVILSTLPLPDEAGVEFGDFVSVILLSVVVTALVSGLVMYVLRNTSARTRQ